jgi:hypothetical protein
MGVLKKVLEFDVLSLICFLVILIVQLKILRSLRTLLSLMMYYGKQIEETRKAALGGIQSKYGADVPPHETGLYEVLKE